MNAGFLDTQLTAYLGLRTALGFQLHAARLLLPEFVAYLQARDLTEPVRAQVALDWACVGSARRGPGGSARRLSIARGFLSYLRASLPQTEVPAHGLLPTPRRRKPYIFSPAQVTALSVAARESRPRGSLRPHTLATLIGLLVSTGLRSGEAIRLTIADVMLDLDPPQLHIRQTKFGKSRIVPLHPSTAEQLRGYATERAELGYDALSPAFFVAEQGQALGYRAVHAWFLRLCRRLALKAPEGGRGPCLTSFRHTFAVTRLQRWYQHGLDVQALLPHLSVYLGHVRPQESYWYLTAVPELLGAAAERFRTYAIEGGRHDQ